AGLLAANHLPRFLPLMITPAGTLPPAQVLVLGAGVAGLTAIATARRLGAVVSAYDVRPAAREEIASLGATPVDLGLDTSGAEAPGGYAAAMDEAFYERQRAALGDVVATHDAVIATAAVQGGPAPLLVTREAVERMRFGSVVVDCAAATGGNCEVTQPGETVQVGGATVLGPLDLAATMPQAASRMYARNLRELLRHLVREGRVVLDRAEPIAAATLCTRDGQVVLARAREMLGLGPNDEGEHA
ncbi:MAG: Rossmann-fold NAD(P)-binding domain-containing protein, partial [Planctomycetota bacterium]